VAARTGRFEDEGWRVRKDGSRFWANVVISAMRDASGELSGFAKVTRDLTERRRIEELEESERRINEFLAMLGHELRNPLAPIRNAVAIMRERAQADPKQDWARGVIERQVDHLTRLVDDLLDIGRITKGKITLQRQVVDLAAPVSAAVEASRPSFVQKSQTLEVQQEGAALLVDGDPTRLTQIVLNLLTNASKYSPPETRVWLTLTREDEQAVLRVRDEGIGMATELLPRVFDLFFQGERTLARSEGGLGIGLTLVRRLVHLHRGTVTATSPGPGRGSEFEVRFPLAAAPAAQSPEARRADRTTAASRAARVLVVDDNVDSAETMALLIGIWGHEVRTAQDGPSALAAAVEQRPDIILLDLGLPGTSGYEVAARIRAMPELGRPLLVAMTGYGQEEDKRRTRQAGFVHHLTKPVAPDALEEILASLALP
jgi:signal transduction histidine kinase